ncbi:MAG: rod shape-determining protein MreD [Bacteroidales bacterium]|jgi:rod shape-determining protein MreD|nr:rod shape-determining protein MreD [Bacteroidales bacterium]
MNNTVLIRNILRFAFLLLLQVLVLDHIHIANEVTPYIYILAILLIPFGTPKWLLLIVAFVLGFLMDVFLGTMGLHMAATVLTAFVRPMLLSMVSLGRDFDRADSPSIKELGWDWFIWYAIILIVIHHAAIFMLEIFRFDEFGTTLLRILYSSFATFVLVMLSQFLFFSRKNGD